MQRIKLYRLLGLVIVLMTTAFPVQARSELSSGALSIFSHWGAPGAAGQTSLAGRKRHRVFLPYLTRSLYIPPPPTSTPVPPTPTPRPTPTTCEPIVGESYDSFPIIPPPTTIPAEINPDLNLSMRGYAPTNAFAGLINLGGDDPNAPQLYGLFADQRTSTFGAQYRVYDWDWDCNCRGSLLTNWDVTLSGLVTTPGETIHVPRANYSIGGGFQVLVLYASTDRITLKYTGEDNVISGYTLHVERICVEPSLLSLYRSWNSAGRSQLPALRAGQAFGRALNAEIQVAIRDTGMFMDPRYRYDWWQGR